jgi:hypothetical protein
LAPGSRAAAPGSIDRLLLAVDDIEAAREQLLARRRGVRAVPRRRWWPRRRLPRRHRRARPGPGSGGALLRLVRLLQRPGRQRLATADGNGWRLQEITERLPGGSEGRRNRVRPGTSRARRISGSDTLLPRPIDRRRST